MILDFQIGNVIYHVRIYKKINLSDVIKQKDVFLTDYLD